jgi:hypothetical protein
VGQGRRGRITRKSSPTALYELRGDTDGPMSDHDTPSEEPVRSALVDGKRVKAVNGRKVFAQFIDTYLLVPSR